MPRPVVFYVVPEWGIPGYRRDMAWKEIADDVPSQNVDL